jgi:tripartite-type tricarboxylate transporter receptor subunit TctC
VAKAAPDGTTLLMGPSGPMTMNPALYSKLPYDPLRDFAPISMIGDFPLILVVSASLPANSVKELVAYAKARPDQVNYAASAAPFQLAAELFNQRTGTKFLHIPYKSSGDSVNAVMSGQVTMAIMDPPPAIGPLKGGRVRGLAVTGAARDPNWPDVPTLAEAGVPGYAVQAWYAILAPKGTPADVVDKLSTAIAAAVKSPDVSDKLQSLGNVPVGSSAVEAATMITQEAKRWHDIITAAGIKPE